MLMNSFFLFRDTLLIYNVFAIPLSKQNLSLFSILCQNFYGQLHLHPKLPIKLNSFDGVSFEKAYDILWQYLMVDCIIFTQQKCARKSCSFAVLQHSIRLLIWKHLSYQRKVWYTKNGLYLQTILVDNYYYHRSITDLLTSHIPSIVIVKSPDQHMLTYMVPKNKRRLFQVMLLDLESHYAEWGIRNLSLLSNDLKDIYMNLTLDSDSRRIITPICKQCSHGMDMG